MTAKSLTIVQDQLGTPRKKEFSVMSGGESNQSVSEVPYAGNAALVTLGCAKNQVDSEVMLGVLEKTGYQIVTELESADVVVVNTCGFLESAVKESIDAILDAASYKTTGRLRTLMVAGCMVERYKGDIAAEFPEVDAFVSVDDILKVGQTAQGEEVDLLQNAGRPYFLYDDTLPRRLSTKTHTAYVKISEGCNRPCTFCIIPQLRGKMRSRTIASVVSEVQNLVSQGVKEINLVAQDLTSYGKDLKNRGLSELLSALDTQTDATWIRLLYAYPVGTTPELIAQLHSLPSVCNYYDIPLQHSSERVLKMMKRPVGKFSPRAIVKTIRDSAPDIAIRTTFIVGFPGETEEDVDDLVHFVSEGHFSSVGVFTYSPEEGTESFLSDMHIDETIKESRKARVMQAQQDAVIKRNLSREGETLKVLLEGYHEDTDLLFTGRAEFQAPEVDGVIIINDVDPSVGEVVEGHFYEVEITETAGYDLVGKIISSVSP